MRTRDLRRQLTRFRAEKSLLGGRVRLFDVRGGCIEYVKLSSNMFQRVDHPCYSRRAPQRFPVTLPGTAFEGGDGAGPLVVTVAGPTYTEVQHPPSKACGTYRMTHDNIWMLRSRVCPETKHHLDVQKQRRMLEKSKGA